MKNNITPNHYDLFLKPDITNAVFSGEVKIQLTSLQDFQNIELDAAEIDVITASIQQNNRVFPLEFTLDEKNESITFHCEEKIHKG